MVSSNGNSGFEVVKNGDRFEVVGVDGYTRKTMFEGETLEEIWTKLGAKLGQEVELEL